MSLSITKVRAIYERNEYAGWHNICLDYGVEPTEENKSLVCKIVHDYRDEKTRSVDHNKKAFESFIDDWGF